MTDSALQIQSRKTIPQLVLILFSLTILSWLSTAGHAQTHRVARNPGQGKLFDNIVKDLVDQNLNFNTRGQLDQNRTTNASAELRRAQQGIKRFADDANRLISALRIEEQYSPYVRPLIGDALRVKADADALTQRSMYMTSITQFTDEYANIDRQWRVLANRLRQIPNVGNRVVQEVDRVTQSAEAIARGFNLDPQMQRDQLYQAFYAMAADLSYLADDIRTDLWNHPERDALANQVWDLQNRTSQLTAALQSNHGYQYVKGYYEQFFEKWMTTKRKLRAVDNRYIQRNVDRITQLNERLHELLWLPPFVDGGEILYMANTLKSNVDVICEDISLKRLIGLPNSVRIFGSAKEFYTMCESFRNTVANSQQFDAVQWDFRELDVAWNDLRNLIVPLNDPTSLQQIALIDNSIMDLRDALGQRSSVDSQEIMEVVSTIDNMSNLLYYDLNQYIGQSNRYPASFRSQAVNSARGLHNAAHEMYEAVVQQYDTNAMRQRSDDLVNRWNNLQQFLAKIPASDRELIAKTSKHIAPALAKLQIMLY